MIKHTGNTKKSDLGAFFRVFFSFFILGVVFFGFLGQAKIAKGENDYIDNIYLWLDENNYWRLHFHVKTSFSVLYTIEDDKQYSCATVWQTDIAQGWVLRSVPSATGYTVNYGANFAYDWHKWYNGTVLYQAGKSYDVYLVPYMRFKKVGSNWLAAALRDNDIERCEENDYNCYYKKQNLLHKIDGYYQSSNGYFSPEGDYTFRFLYLNDEIDLDIQDADQYGIRLHPTIDIEYPFDEAEITGNFTIRGTYDYADLEIYKYLGAFLMPDWGVGIPNLNELYHFGQLLDASEGDIDIKVSGVPAGDYNLYFLFVSEDETTAYNPMKGGISIKIADDIPYQLPITGETPPQHFSLYSAGHIYTEYSNYATPTAMFSTLTGAIEPIITTLGDNLTFFTSQFSQSKAKQTGESIGQAILIVRAYANNLNSFFNDLPIAQVLFFYILLLIVVVVFRIIRQAIGLIPFT